MGSLITSDANQLPDTNGDTEPREAQEQELTKITAWTRTAVPQATLMIVRPQKRGHSPATPEPCLCCPLVATGVRFHLQIRSRSWNKFNRNEAELRSINMGGERPLSPAQTGGRPQGKP